MEILFQAVNVLITLVVTFGLPTMAYPLAKGAKQIRQRIDDRINWEDERHEQVEDAITYSTTAIVSVAMFALFGVIHLWYTSNYTLLTHDWLHQLTSGNTVNLLGISINWLVVLYWSTFWVWFIAGWTRPVPAEVSEEE